MDMKITGDTRPNRSAEAPEPEGGGASPTFSLASIQEVRDFTARKTLEQAHALVTGLRGVLAAADDTEADAALAVDLERVGIGAADAERLAAEAVALMELMADRDRKADVFHAAVKEAGQSERAMYEKLATLARVLRAELRGSPTALGKLGVPALGAELQKARPRPVGKAIFSAVASKS
jgi:hypothetical protein